MNSHVASWVVVTHEPTGDTWTSPVCFRNTNTPLPHCNNFLYADLKNITFFLKSFEYIAKEYWKTKIGNTRNKDRPETSQLCSTVSVWRGIRTYTFHVLIYYLRFTFAFWMHWGPRPKTCGGASGIVAPALPTSIGNHLTRLAKNMFKMRHSNPPSQCTFVG